MNWIIFIYIFGALLTTVPVVADMKMAADLGDNEELMVSPLDIVVLFLFWWIVDLVDVCVNIYMMFNNGGHSDGNSLS